MNNSGNIKVYEDRVEISHDSRFGILTQHGHAGTRVIPLDQITSVDFRAAGRVIGGTIRFSHAGGSNVPVRLVTASKEGPDPNTVAFTRGHQPEFERVRDEVLARMGKRSSPAAAPSVADELSKLSALRDQGVLTDEEFAVEKRRLLGR